MYFLQRVNQCLRDACRDLHEQIPSCKKFIDCGRGNIQGFLKMKEEWIQWKNNSKTVDCFNPSSGSFPYGIYVQTVLISTKHSIVTRYIYSLFWGFQV